MRRHLKITVPFLLLALLVALPNDVNAGPKDGKGTPWDTVMANIQVIESINEPDSVKNTLTQKLFSDFELTAEDYRRFYNDFLKRAPEKQAAFLKRVEEIILEWMNWQYEGEK